MFAECLLFACAIVITALLLVLLFACNRYEKLKRDTEKRSELFYSIAHELKTPLSVILGAIQLIENNNKSCLTYTGSSAQHFHAIRQNSYRLLRFVNTLLEIARIEAANISLNTTNCNIVYLVEEITQSIAPYARQKGINLVFDTGSEEITAGVDIEKFERIILNLLSNAIKFTDQGGNIKVTTSIENDNAIISVSDTGCGIPSHMKDRIFEHYNRGNADSRKIEGSGIGLWLVRSFVKLHKGNIRVISEENKGSEFIVEIPLGCIKQEDFCCSAAEVIKRRQNTLEIEFSDINADKLEDKK